MIGAGMEPWLRPGYKQSSEKKVPFEFSLNSRQVDDYAM